MSRETKSFEAIETKVIDGAAGLVECAFAVTGNLDRGNDIIHPGAFAKAIANSRPPTVLFSHVADDINQVLGKTLSWNELLPGDPALPSKLKSLNAKADGPPQFGCVKAQIKFDLDTPAGKLGYTHVAHENLKEWSFAYLIADGGAEMEYPKSGGDQYVNPIRHLKDISEVLDITLCVIGMNPATSTVAWKSFSGQDKTEDIAAIREALEGFKEDPDPSPDFDYLTAARDAVADLIVGVEATSTPEVAATSVTVEPEGVPDWMLVGSIEALRVLATDPVPDNDTPTPDVADLLGLTPFGGFEIIR